MNSPIGDRLLWAITVNGHLTSRSFTSLFDQLVAHELDSEEEAVPQRRRVTYWLLDALGHCETFTEQGTSHLEPSIPCLSRLPMSGFPRVMLTGGRQPGTVRELENVATELGGVVTIEPAEHRLGVLPDRIEVEAELPDALEAIARKLHIAWQATPSAWVLCNLSVGLEAVVSRLEWGPVEELDWRRRCFDPAALRLRDDFVDTDPVLVRYEHPYTRQLRYELRRGDEAARIDGDWGRYAVLNETQRHVLVYDERRYLLAVPWGVPLPKLLRRALTCCSGRPPRSIKPSKGGPGGLSVASADVYVGVVPVIAAQVSARLGQRLVRGNLSQIGE